MGNINTGFNRNNIETQMEAIQKSYEQVSKALTDDFKSGMVDKVAEYWACQEAVDFWKSVADTVEKLIEGEDGVFGTYQKLFKTMNSCAHTWAENTGKGSVWDENEKQVKKYNAKLNTSSIKENINNDRGINGQQVKTITSSAFETAISTIGQALGTAKDAIDASGFIDEQGQQMKGVQGGLDQLLSTIKGAVQQLQKSLTEEIEKCIKKYGETAGSVAGAYSGGAAPAGMTTMN